MGSEHSHTTLRIDSNKHTCAINSNSASCAPVIYSIDGIRYSKVCGKIKAYQFNSSDAFRSRPNRRSIDSNCVDGISLTHGISRKHTSLVHLKKLFHSLISTVPVPAY